MWRALLKKHQPPFVVPPHYSRIEVLNTQGVYSLTVSEPLNDWSLVTAEGVVIRKAEPHEILSELERYPKIRVTLYKSLPESWLVATDEKGIARVKKLPPWTHTELTPLTPLICRVFGTALILDTPDVKYPFPWYIAECLAYLHSEDLQDFPDTLSRKLIKSQQFAFELLYEEEKALRKPPLERKITDIISKEKGQIVNLTETSDGYLIEFHYRGRLRRIKVDETLRLLDAGMCLAGTTYKHTLDSFLALLHYEEGYSGYIEYYT